jgi:hypothetical protein
VPGSNQILQSDSSGNLTWVSDAVGSTGGGIATINADGTTAQSLSVTTTTAGTLGWIDAAGDHKLSIPIGSASKTGFVSSTDWSAFNSKVDRTGDTMTGNLDINGSTDNVQLAVKGHSTQNANLAEFKNNTGTLLYSVEKTGTPVAATDLVNKAYVTTQTGNYVLKTGDTVSGILNIAANTAQAHSCIRSTCKATVRCNSRSKTYSPWRVSAIKCSISCSCSKPTGWR